MPGPCGQIVAVPGRVSTLALQKARTFVPCPALQLISSFTRSSSRRVTRWSMAPARKSCQQILAQIGSRGNGAREARRAAILCHHPSPLSAPGSPW
jgi:hypothetical protein